uniref:Uncharacterized protein n=1 Tax=Chromera velia CCMP2878 TaxID=1169474 RepID=A0A0G4GS34_9ALVE|eukprot:Cvel_23077.t1-p1 / transcript=Cvel_23077.t1 / gene=Cvel_23077 / organism=Chromera_velia_CCMP2878 / gene_product=hypothetical protein / transcript_product=hypothetical protein / location=Cvel_scaffold2337:14648-23202(-) / protein_length=875 / sequence_SO=supercontig / SO=protein_coding / is_pseudo=false
MTGGSPAEEMQVKASKRTEEWERAKDYNEEEEKEKAYKKLLRQRAKINSEESRAGQWDYLPEDQRPAPVVGKKRFALIFPGTDESVEVKYDEKEDGADLHRFLTNAAKESAPMEMQDVQAELYCTRPRREQETDKSLFDEVEGGGVLLFGPILAAHRDFILREVDTLAVLPTHPRLLQEFEGCRRWPMRFYDNCGITKRNFKKKKGWRKAAAKSKPSPASSSEDEGKKVKEVDAQGDVKMGDAAQEAGCPILLPPPKNMKGKAGSRPKPFSTLFGSSLSATASGSHSPSLSSALFPAGESSEEDAGSEGEKRGGRTKKARQKNSEEGSGVKERDTTRVTSKEKEKKTIKPKPIQKEKPKPKAKQSLSQSLSRQITKSQSNTRDLKLVDEEDTIVGGGDGLQHIIAEDIEVPTSSSSSSKGSSESSLPSSPAAAAAAKSGKGGGSSSAKAKVAAKAKQQQQPQQQQNAVSEVHTHTRVLGCRLLPRKDTSEQRVKKELKEIRTLDAAGRHFTGWLYDNPHTLVGVAEGLLLVIGQKMEVKKFADAEETCSVVLSFLETETVVPCAFKNDDREKGIKQEDLMVELLKLELQERRALCLLALGEEYLEVSDKLLENIRKKPEDVVLGPKFGVTADKVEATFGVDLRVRSRQLLFRLNLLRSLAGWMQGKAPGGGLNLIFGRRGNDFKLSTKFGPAIKPCLQTLDRACLFAEYSYVNAATKTFFERLYVDVPRFLADRQTDVTALPGVSRTQMQTIARKEECTNWLRAQMKEMTDAQGVPWKAAIEAIWAPLFATEPMDLFLGFMHWREIGLRERYLTANMYKNMEGTLLNVIQGKVDNLPFDLLPAQLKNVIGTDPSPQEAGQPPTEEAGGTGAAVQQ